MNSVRFARAQAIVRMVRNIYPAVNSRDRLDLCNYLQIDHSLHANIPGLLVRYTGRDTRPEMIEPAVYVEATTYGGRPEAGELYRARAIACVIMSANLQKVGMPYFEACCARYRLLEG